MCNLYEVVTSCSYFSYSDVPGFYTKTEFESSPNGVRVKLPCTCLDVIENGGGSFTLTPIDVALSRVARRVHGYMVKQQSVRGGCLGS